MAFKHKIIRDSIHGDIKIDGIYLELLETPELQRLYNIKQLGFAHLVFPGAHHSRLEHSLGTYNITIKAANLLKLEEKDKEIISCAALIHDIGHGPFSHTLESILRNTINIDHTDLTEKLILGDYDIFYNKESEFIKHPDINEILLKNNINQKEIIDSIKGIPQKKQFLGQLLNSAIDTDQLDYLIRDAYYTGVAYGIIDIERYLQTLTLNKGKLLVKRKGVGAVESILMARALMYSSIYFHKTVRIAELMLSKAIEMIYESEPFNFFKMTDAELENELKKMGSYQYEIVTRLKYRKLFKQAYSASNIDLNDQNKKIIKNLENSEIRREKEKEIEEKLNISSGHIIIDIPYKELYETEPRIDQTDIAIIDENRIRTLKEFTPLAEAIKLRNVTDWSIMIITDEKYRDIVSKKVKKILFN